MPRVFLLTFLLAATALPAAAQDRRSRDADYRVDTTFTFDRRGTVSVTAGGGDVTVRGWDRNEVRIQARSERYPIRLDASSTRLSLEASRSRSDDGEFDVMVPTGVRVTVRTSNGDITITGTRGAVEATAQNGDVEVSDAAERIFLKTYSGDIVARRLAGAVDAGSLSGDMELLDVTGDIEATTVSGDVDMRGVTARYVRARSTSGEITYDGAIDATGRYELASHSGGVALTVPTGAGALVTVSTYSGTIDSDFPITLKPGEHGIGTTKRFSFEIGKGDARISAESFSGDITIRSRRTPDR